MTASRDKRRKDCLAVLETAMGLISCKHAWFKGGMRSGTKRDAIGAIEDMARELGVASDDARKSLARTVACSAGLHVWNDTSTHEDVILAFQETIKRVRG